MSGKVSKPIITNGLVLALDAANKKSYPGSGTVWSDLSGNANTGTLTNGPTFDSSNNGSINFDGVDDYIDCGDYEMDGLTGLAVEAWFKSDIINSQNRRIVSKDQVGVQGAWILWIQASDLIWQTHNGSSFKIAEYSAYLEDTNWHHAVGTLHNGTNTLYLDGVAVASVDSVGALDDADNEKIVIGADSDASSPENAWNGHISNVKVYTKGLSSSEVLQNYNATKDRFGL
tara:strand:- start:193 stop:882 length:690 start_codon:yes stop_codon:yes gene_type:complete